MIRTVVVFALIVVAAQAFVSPANRAVAKPAFASRTAPKMMIDGSIMEQSAVSAAANTQLIASQVTDFGGYLFPVFGIIALAGLILFLSPPLADPN